MHKIMKRIAEVMAVLGASVLGLLIIMTCVSIVGRELKSTLSGDWFQTVMPGFSQWLIDLGIGPVLGDFELLENGMPFAIFAFLPLAQISASHATVDVFTSRFPPGLLRWMAAVTEVIFAIVLIVFAWKLYEGMLGKQRYNEITYLIQFKVWYAFALALFAACVAAVVGVYMAGVRVAEAIQGREIVAAGPEADH